jgi:ABC-type transport system involved in multi-copper enzyme maturation permease subunit
MKTYLNYIIHKKWLQTIVMTMIPTLIMVLILTSSNYTRFSAQLRAPRDLLVSILFIMIVMIVIVIFRFSSLRNTKEVDLYYALPISKQRLFLAHYLYGLLQAIFVWTILYFFSLLTVVLKTNGGYQESWLILIYFIVLFYLVILYSITVFVFLRANTIFDGIAFIILFNVLFLFIPLFFSTTILDTEPMLNHPLFLNPFYSVTEISGWMTELSNIMDSYVHKGMIESVPFVITNSLIFLTLGVVMFLYDYHKIDETKTEYIGQISNSKLGYKFYIPAILVTSIPNMFYLGSAVTYVLLIILISAGFIGFFIYKRGLKITWVDAGYVLIPTLVGMIIGVLVNGFH